MTPKEQHKIRMLAKKRMRDRVSQMMDGPVYTPANLGVNHPDKGMSLKDHLIERAKRETEKSS